MYCVNCGSAIADKAKFCTYCGFRNAAAQTDFPMGGMPRAGQTLPAPAAQNPFPPAPVQELPPAEEHTPAVPDFDEAQGLPAPEQSVSARAEGGVSLVKPEGMLSAPAEEAPEPAPAPASTPINAGVAPEPAPISTPINAALAPEPAPNSTPINAGFAPEPAPASIPLNLAPAPTQQNFSTAVRTGGEIAAPRPESAPSEPEQRPEKRYTFGHIAICLAAVAVMAIVAGVFAGLYFMNR